MNFLFAILMWLSGLFGGVSTTSTTQSGMGLQFNNPSVSQNQVTNKAMKRNPSIVINTKDLIFTPED